jgi:hypothetical protein
MYCFTELAPLAPTPLLPRWGREPESSPQRGEVGRGGICTNLIKQYNYTLGRR